MLEISERCRSWSSGLDAMVPGLSSGGDESSSFIEKRPCCDGGGCVVEGTVTRGASTGTGEFWIILRSVSFF